MELEEAIKHCEEVAEENRNVDEEELGLIYCDDTECIENHKKRCFKCADEHEQLAEWLRDYKRLLDQEPCEDCISRANALRVAKNEYLRGWHNALCKALSEKYSIHCEEGNLSVIQEETITGLGLSMDCAVGKDVESYMSTIPSVTPKGVTVTDFADKCRECGKQKNGKWIPVSERLPKEFEFVNCTCRSLIDDRDDWVIETVYVPQPQNSPYSDWGNIPMLNSGKCEVIAWMHRDIPEPYQEEKE